MDSNKRIIIIFILIAVLAGGFFLLNRSLPEGAIIVTRISSEKDSSILNQQHLSDSDFLSAIVLFNPQKLEKPPIVLTKDFTTAHSPELSKESDKMVFSGKIDPNSNRQIWIMNLNTKKTIALSDENMNCFDPLFLPNDHVAFSCDWKHDVYGNGSFLFSLNPDNGQFKRITFHPHVDHSGSMLHDGRLLWISRQIYPVEERQNLMALRPDGTNSNLFYELPKGLSIRSKVRENSNQQLFFTATNDNSDSGTALYRFSYINPVTSTQKIYQSTSGRMQSLYPMKDGSILISYQTNSSKPFGIFEFNENNGAVNPLLTDDRYHYLEPIVIKGHPFVPKVLPTALNDDMDIGIIVFIDPEKNSAGNVDSNRNLIQVESLNGWNKEFLAAEDGSFYLHVSAKVPVRFSQVSEIGEVIKGPYPWVWVMPGDRRGFTGWDPAQLIAPANQVPQAIHEPAVQIIVPSHAELSLIDDFKLFLEVSDED